MNKEQMLFIKVKIISEPEIWKNGKEVVTVLLDDGNSGSVSVYSDSIIKEDDVRELIKE